MKKSIFLLPIVLVACSALPSADENTATQSLSGQWQIVELAKKKINEPNAVLSFDAESSRFSAQTDCNGLFGRYQINTTEKALTFGQMASTRKMCPKIDIEMRVGKILPQVKQYRLEKEYLKMLDENGNTVLRGYRIRSQTE